MMRAAAFAGLVLLAGSGFVRAEEYLGREQFLALAFGAVPSAQRVLWMSADAQARARTTAGIAPAGLRVRYWSEGSRSAWILEDIGKELPITFGVVVDEGHIAELRVLAFRESRGGEIRHGFFTEQFRGAALDTAGKLDRGIDGITGATLSVRATDRVVRLALWLDAESRRGKS